MNSQRSYKNNNFIVKNKEKNLLNFNKPHWLLVLLLYGRKYIELIINLYTVYICFLAAFSLQYVFDNYKFNRSVTVTGVSYG